MRFSIETGLLGEPEGSESGGEAATAAAGTCKTKPAALLLSPLFFSPNQTFILLRPKSLILHPSFFLCPLQVFIVCQSGSGLF